MSEDLSPLTSNESSDGVDPPEFKPQTEEEHVDVHAPISESVVDVHTPFSESEQHTSEIAEQLVDDVPNTLHPY